MAKCEDAKTKPRYKYDFGLKAILQNGKEVDKYEDVKESMMELTHFITQNSNYQYSELTKMDIREFLKIFAYVEKDIQRKITQSKK